MLRLSSAAGVAALILSAIPSYATVNILSVASTTAIPVPLGTSITWTATAQNSDPNPVMFQFNVAAGSHPFSLISDFNVGQSAAGSWVSLPFTYATIAGEGIYTLEVVAKDFVTGETATGTSTFTLTPIATTQSVVSKSSNPLVALFSAPSCGAGNTMRVAYSTGAKAPNYTSWVACNPPVSMNFYVAGMRASTTYTMYSQVQNGSTIYNGVSRTFTTGTLPKQLPFSNTLPSLTVSVGAGAGAYAADDVLLWGFTNGVVPTATDLSGNILWFYWGGVNPVFTRPLTGGSILLFENGNTWSSVNTTSQLLQQIDLSGNVVRQTNTGILAQQLSAMGAVDGGACMNLPNPIPVGTSCLDGLSHDAIHFSLGGAQYTATLVYVEKLFPPGTQGTDPNGPPVDILGDMLLVLNSDWQLVWYWDAFEKLDINRAAVLNEVCGTGPSSDCRTHLLLASSALDWTHANTIYYMPQDQDFLVSLRDQDWLVKIDFQTRSGNVLWTMGPDGDFAFET